MLSHKTLSALAEHGDVWCMDLQSLTRFLLDGELKKPTPRIPRVSGSIAVIPLHGVITKRGGYFSDGTDRVSRTLAVAMESPNVAGVVLDIDSPGGSSYGLMEFADAVYSYRDHDKPLLAVSNPLAASAAYWAGTSADQLIVTPSGDVGSVGVWSLHIDASKLLDDIGIKPTFIFAGKYKVEGNQAEPLAEEAREEIQRGVDEVYSDFISTLARNRGVTKSAVEADFGQGRVLSANRSKSAGMVDRVATLDDVIGSMTKGSGGGSRSAEKLLLDVWHGESVAAEPSGKAVEASKRRRERRRRAG